MAKIIDRRSLGIQPVYDIGVEQDHNFVLSSGLVASNCFNKSHSTAYGYVTYQTAYLKANYPTEYMAALLTSNSGDQDKVQKYIANCLSLNIQVEPPDINRSGVDFTPLENSILFGLSAVRSVGEGAIESLLKVRDVGGKFISLADLCDRIDPRAVNRRALEALIQCGAFDCISLNRNQLVHDLDLVLDWAQSRAKDRLSGQGSLFDLMGDTQKQKSSAGFEAPKAPTVEDFPKQEKLRLEKELLGFYISDHPLKSVQQSARILAPVNLSDLEDQPDDRILSAIVMLTSVKPVVTKKGDSMAILQIEDLSGHTEAVVFPKSFARIKEYIVADARLMVWGKVDRRDEQVQFIIEDAEPIDQVQMVMVELEPKDAGDYMACDKLRNILKEQRGEDEKAKIPVVAIVSDLNRRQFIRLGGQFKVQNPQATVAALTQEGFHARTSLLVGT